MADLVGRAGSRVEVGRSVHQPVQFGLQESQLADGAADVVGAGAEQLEHVAARCLAFVAQGNNAADLTQGQSERLRRPDERESVEHGVAVIPVAGWGAIGGLDEPDVLVVAQRLRAQARAARYLTDQQRLTFLCTGTLTVAAVQIDVLHVADCPNVAITRDRLEAVLARAAVTASVRYVQVDTEDDAATTGMRGSPTILINGADPFADGDGAPSLSCRLFRNGNGLEGAPSVDALIEALTR